MTDPLFEEVKSNLVRSIVTKLEDEVVKELVSNIYHYGMQRLNPDDVTVKTAMQTFDPGRHGVFVFVDLVHPTDR